jgi:streptogramin lyase
MNTIRAASFTNSAGSRLQPVADWPRLPSTITLDRVVGVGVDSRGFVYAAHRGEHPLLCLNADGTLCREVGAALQKRTTAYDLRGPVPIPIATRYWLHGLHIDPWDNVWLTDVGRHLVMKFDPAGALVMTLGMDGEGGCDQRRFAQPTHVCVVPSGEIFVTDGYGNSRVVKFSARGEYLLEWGVSGTATGEFHTPHVITLGHDGRLYLTDRENDRLQVFDQDGKLQAVWPGLHSVDGLFAAPDGFIYGSAGMDHAVLRFDREGHLLNSWAEPGMFCYPHGIAVDSAGAIFTAESGDVWIRTGDLATAHAHLAPRTGPEGSALQKLMVKNAP